MAYQVLGTLRITCQLHSGQRYSDILRRLADILANASWYKSTIGTKLNPDALVVEVALMRPIEQKTGMLHQPDDVARPFLKWFGIRDVKVDVVPAANDGEPDRAA